MVRSKPDGHGLAVRPMIFEHTPHYYRIMTGPQRMPVFIEQGI